MIRIIGVLGLAALLAGAARAQNLPNDVMVARFVDVGQGDATILEFSCGVVLIDAGGDGPAATARLLAQLEAVFADRPELNRTINSIIITHNHVDHTVSLTGIRNAFTVVNVVENGQRRSAYDRGETTLRALERDIAAGRTATVLTRLDDAMIEDDRGLWLPVADPVACDGTDPDIRVLSADLAENPGWSASDFRDKNNQSVVVRVDFGDASFLFTGDLETPAIATMVDYYDGSGMLDVDVYQAGHHGAENGTSDVLVNAMTPAIAVISNGTCEHIPGPFDANSYGHPRASAVGLLMGAITRRRSRPKQGMVATAVRDQLGEFHRMTMRDAIYDTAWDGTVSIRATREGTYRVTIERQENYGACVSH